MHLLLPHRLLLASLVTLGLLLGAAMPVDAARGSKHGGKRLSKRKAKERGLAVARKGDTIDRLAKRHGLSVASFRALNHLAAHQKVRAGKRYRVSRTARLAGGLRAGVSIGTTTNAYVVVNPLRAFGRPNTVALLRAAAERTQRRFPDGHRVVFEDISVRGGGFLPPHTEHRGGQEVDASYYHTDVTSMRHLRIATQDNFDAERTWFFLKSLIDTGHIDRVLVDWRLQVLLIAEARKQGATEDDIARLFQHPRPRRSHVGIIRHAPGHNGHCHIRFKCPDGDCDLDEAEVRELIPQS